MIAPDLSRFFRSMWEAVKRLFQRKVVIVPSEVALDRAGICVPCIYHKDGQCLECTCLIHLKVQFAHEKCPKKKWGIYKPKSSRTD